MRSNRALLAYHDINQIFGYYEFAAPAPPGCAKEDFIRTRIWSKVRPYNTITTVEQSVN